MYFCNFCYFILVAENWERMQNMTPGNNMTDGNGNNMTGGNRTAGGNTRDKRQSGSDPEPTRPTPVNNNDTEPTSPPMPRNKTAEAIREIMEYYTKKQQGSYFVFECTMYSVINQ